ncbi:linker for activation of T-cells family member 1 [Emys orbicularis]|uniref:linker for activation of T-cells family member 1 n=1 Tax=Emys orbicularis TaxID=82168 RepID=UPI0031FD038F
MEAVSLAGVLWAFVLVLPAVLATALCIGCRDTGSPGAEWDGPPLPPPLMLRPALSPAHGAQAVGDYEYKPPPCVPPNSFMVLTRANYPSRNQIKQQPVPPAEQFLSIPRSPQAPQSRQVSFTRTETDNDSVPSYENEERPRGDDDDDNDYNNEIYTPGYVEVLPDSVTETSPTELVTSGPELRDSASSVGMGDEYENMPEAQRESLADSLEYVNMPEPVSGLPDAHYGASDRESEDDGPDYENLHR